MRSAPIHLTELDATIEDLLVGRPMARGQRMLGVEVEHLLLHRITRRSAPLDFCQRLLADLAKDFDAREVRDGDVLSKIRADGFGMSMEPGGQVEFDTEPAARLDVVEQRVQKIMSRAVERLDATEYELVALGHTPVTPVDELGLLPRTRYDIMNREMVRRGRLSRSMMRATAGFQLAYDFSDKVDAARKLVLLNRLSPLLVAISANSREVAGGDSGYASYRHAVWLETDTCRSGIPTGGLDEDTALPGYIDWAKSAIALFRYGDSADAELVATPSVPFVELVQDGVIDQADLELHLSSLFPLVRLRDYLEVRCLDAVEWPLARSMAALLSGLIYCDDAFAKASEVGERLVVRDGEGLTELHRDAAKRGLDAQPVTGGGTFRDLALALIDFSAGTLGGAECDWAQPGDLDAVRTKVTA